MSENLKPEQDGQEPAPAAKAKAPAKAKTARPKTAKTPAKKAVAKKTAAAKPSSAKTKTAKAGTAKASAEKPKAAPRKRKAKAEEAIAEAGAEAIAAASFAFVEDPIGDTTDGEGRFVLEPIADSEADAELAAYVAEAVEEAEDEAEAAAIAEIAGELEVEAEDPAAEAAPGKLERLQKILSQAGIASRRRAEEMIVEGRVMVNGQVVTALGSKADPERDHIRVDGKLLHGAERHRYFMLNKPKGYVTTVSDPEGRPTVMEFFEKLGQRVYPVGRLDYQSEGLLLMTNDGELANQLTRAASGVEKTYLVKVAGQPGEEKLDQLREGVAIERGKPGSPRVRTAPAHIRQVREGENPWYEVVLIEGRNRELRKMFSTIGHFVEKIRRVGYGPLILDMEPGRFRELTAEELAELRLAAAGKLKPRKMKPASYLPKEAGRRAEAHKTRPQERQQRPFRSRQERPAEPGWKPRRQEFGGGRQRPVYGQGERRERNAGPRERGTGERFERPQQRPFDSRKPFVRRGEDRGFGRGEAPPRMHEAPERNFSRPARTGQGKTGGKSFGGGAKPWGERSGSGPRRGFGAKPGGFSRPGDKDRSRGGKPGGFRPSGKPSGRGKRG